MLSCKQLDEKMQAYLDNELSFLERMSFTVHYLMCRFCKVHVKNWRQFMTSLKSYSSKPLNEDDAKVILKQLDL